MNAQDQYIELKVKPALAWYVRMRNRPLTMGYSRSYAEYLDGRIEECETIIMRNMGAAGPCAQGKAPREGV